LVFGEFSQVDDEEYDWLMKWEWQLVYDEKGKKFAGRFNDNGELILMHEELWKKWHFH